MHIFTNLRKNLSVQSRRYFTLRKDWILLIKKTFTYSEKSTSERLAFILILVYLILKLETENVIYVDESGLNRYYRRAYGRAKRGVKVFDTKHGKRYRRTNIIGAKWGKRHIAVQCYEHSTTAVFFEDWFEFELIPVLPEKTIIVMDNASFHRKKILYKIAERYGVIVLFLPPYSPDFNPIENSWANLKNWLVNNLSRFPSIDFAVDCYFNQIPLLF